MVKIYADVLFVINFLMIFTAYGAVAVIYKLRVRLLHMAAGSFVTSLVSCIMVLFFSTAVNPISIFLLSMAGTYCCLGVTAIKRNITYSLTALFIGVLIGGIRAAGCNTAVTMLILYLSFFILIKKIRAVTVKKQQFCRITVCRGKARAELTALVDTGNELRGENHESVIIAERQAAYCLFENADTALRLIPFKSVDKKDGVLLGVLCDYAIIDGIKKTGIIVAASEVKLGGGVYNALINPSVQTEVI